MQSLQCPWVYFGGKEKPLKNRASAHWQRQAFLSDIILRWKQPPRGSQLGESCVVAHMHLARYKHESPKEKQGHMV